MDRQHWLAPGAELAFFFDEHLHLASISSGLAVSCTKYNVETRYNHPASPARNLLHSQHDRDYWNNITSVMGTRPLSPKLQLHPDLSRHQKPKQQQHPLRGMGWEGGWVGLVVLRWVGGGAAFKVEPCFPSILPGSLTIEVPPVYLVEAFGAGPRLARNRKLGHSAAFPARRSVDEGSLLLREEREICPPIPGRDLVKAGPRFER